MADSYLYIIVALLPLTASMLVTQVNPYHALVIRGILGAVAALVYAVLGAADVALTEALVGTLLAITLYAVAVRSSLVMRLGVLSPAETTAPHAAPAYFDSLLERLRTLLSQYHLRLELVTYPDQQALQTALAEQEVHAVCTQTTPQTATESAIALAVKPYHTTVRIRRLYDILESELASSATSLTYVETTSAEKTP
ncbi:DUF4040 domain-containing protein [Almyronema epifaneia]|uniref:DUF4040 domain-containing protein n=1 Tax=Almyronema epifaneia S1 TaxID=2991925 RepID=A0ABW6IEC3_9CYAN